MEATFIFFGLDDAFGGTIKSESLKSQFAKSYHTRWRTKNDGSDKLWFNFDKTSKV